VSKKQLDKDTLIFVLGIPPLQTAFFSVSFNDYDKLRLIGVPPELIPAVQQTLGLANIQKEEWRDGGAAYQFKLYEEFRIIFETLFLFLDVVLHGCLMERKQLHLDQSCFRYSIVLVDLAGNYMQVLI
jgi:hypothetical protein